MTRYALISEKCHLRLRKMAYRHNAAINYTQPLIIILLPPPTRWPLTGARVTPLYHTAKDGRRHTEQAVSAWRDFSHSAQRRADASPHTRRRRSLAIYFTRHATGRIRRAR